MLTLLRFFITIYFTAIFAFAQSFEKAFYLADKKYQTGRYQQANKINEDLLTKSKGKGFKDEAKANFYAAKIYNASGNYKEVYPAIQKGLALYQSNTEKSSEVYSEGLINAAETYAEVGNYRISSQLAVKADTLFKKYQFKNNTLKHRIKLAQAVNLHKKGFYRRALTEIGLLIDENMETVIGKKKDGRKLNKKELWQVKQELGSLQTRLGQVYMEKGNYASADSAFLAADKWIAKNLGVKSNERVLNQISCGRMDGIVDQDFVSAIRVLNKAINMNKKTMFDPGQRFTNHSIAMIELRSELVRNLAGGKDFVALEKVKRVAESAMRGAYNKNSCNTFYVRNKLDAQYYISRMMLKDAEKVLTPLVEDTFMLAELHPRRYEALEMMYTYKLNTGQTSAKTTTNKDAFNYLQQMVKVRKYLLGEDAPNYHKDLIELAGYIGTEQYKFKEAEQIMQKSLVSVVGQELDPSSVELPGYYEQLAKIYEMNEDFDNAFLYYTKVADMYRVHQGDNSPMYAYALEKISKLQFLSGWYKEAEQTIDKSVDVFFYNENTQRQEFINSLVTRAWVKSSIGDFAEARYSLKKAEKYGALLDVLNADTDIDAMESRAAMFLNIGKFKEAEELLKYTIEDKEVNLRDGCVQLIKPYLLLAKINYKYGNYPDADIYINKALKITLSIYDDKSIAAADCYYLMQKLKYAIGDYEQSKKYLEKAIANYSAKFSGKHVFLTESYLDMANLLYISKEDPALIDDYLKKALDIVKENLYADHPLYAQTIKEIAKYYFKINKLADAEKYLDKAAGIYKEKLGRKNINIAEIFVLKADVCVASGRLKDAEANYDRGIQIYTKYFSKDHPDLVNANGKLARLYYLKGDSKKAITLMNDNCEKYVTYIAKYFPALSEREKVKFWSLIKSDFEFYDFLAIKYSDQNPTLLANSFNHSLMTKSILLNNSLKIKQSILNSGDPELVRIHDNYIAKKELLTHSLSMNEEDQKKNDIDPRRLQNEIEDLEKDLSKKSSLFGLGVKNKTINWSDIKNELGPNDVAINILRVKNTIDKSTDTVVYAAQIITKKSANPELVIIPSGNQLEGKYLKYYRNNVRFNMEEEMSFKVFWEPVFNKTNKGGMVYFSPEGVYNQINVETLRMPGGDFVIDQQQIVIVGNMASLALDKKKKNTKKDMEPGMALLFGNPQFYSSASALHTIVQLPGTEQEAHNIQSLFEQKGWETVTETDTAASEKNLKHFHNPKVLHIATHGFFKEVLEKDFPFYSEELLNPLNRSGILLKFSGDMLGNDKMLNFNTKEGILTANEAMNLYMDKTEIVVLSACETGLGQVQSGEGVYGLQRSFLIAGAHSVIMSLFKVSDAVTKDLMTEFYKNWLTTGDKRQSFLKAKLAIKKLHPEPVSWGAFVMVSNQDF